jgi:hypothetical protein
MHFTGLGRVPLPKTLRSKNAPPSLYIKKYNESDIIYLLYNCVVVSWRSLPEGRGYGGRPVPHLIHLWIQHILHCVRVKEAAEPL